MRDLNGKRRNRSKFIRGAVAGFVATAPMTLAMEILYRKLPPTEKNPLPPQELTMKAAEAVGVKEKLGSQERFSVTLGLHFAYGAVAGLFYAASSDRIRLPGSLRGKTHGLAEGALFGLGLWAGSYMGWIPAVKMMSPASQHPIRRSALMIAVHMVWGAATGFLMDRMTPSTVSAFRDISTAHF